MTRRKIEPPQWTTFNLPWYSKNQAAKRLRRSVSVIDGWIADGLLVTFEVPGNKHPGITRASVLKLAGEINFD